MLYFFGMVFARHWKKVRCECSFESKNQKKSIIQVLIVSYHLRDKIIRPIARSMTERINLTSVNSHVKSPFLV